MDLGCFSCFIQSLLSALWLVDDSAAVSLRYVLTRERMTIFCVFQLVPFVVFPAVFLVISWLVHVHSWTSAHLKPSTAQDVTTLCSSHSCLTEPNLLYFRKPSEVVPSFPFLPPFLILGTQEVGQRPTLEIIGDCKTSVDWINGHAKLKTRESTVANTQNLLRDWRGRGVHLRPRTAEWATLIFREHNIEADVWAEKGAKGQVDERVDTLRILGWQL